MKKMFLAMGLAAALALPVAAFAQEESRMNDPAKMKQTLKAAFVLSLAQDIGLSDQQAVQLLKEYRQHNSRIEELRGQQQQLREQLMREEGDAGAALEKLMNVDQQLREAQAQAAQQIGADLDPAQRAKLYLLLSTMDEHVASVAGGAAPSAAHQQMLDRSAGQQAPAQETAQPAASPEEQIRNVLNQWAESLKAQEIEQLMTTYSEDFEHYEYGDKAGMADFMNQAKAMGYLEGIEVAMEDADFQIDGNQATVYPVELIGNFGQITCQFTLQQQDGGWKIVGLEMSGV